MACHVRSVAADYGDFLGRIRRSRNPPSIVETFRRITLPPSLVELLADAVANPPYASDLIVKQPTPPVIASAAKQSSFLVCSKAGLLRCARTVAEAHVLVLAT